jgi:hypothetical protein
MPTSDPIAAALDAVASPSGSGQTPKVEMLFGDRPAVLEAIKRARRDRQLSYQQIATALCVEDGVTLSSSAVKNWLSRQGIR